MLTGSVEEDVASNLVLSFRALLLYQQSDHHQIMFESEVEALLKCRLRCRKAFEFFVMSEGFRRMWERMVTTAESEELERRNHLNLDFAIVESGGARYSTLKQARSSGERGRGWAELRSQPKRALGEER